MDRLVFEERQLSPRKQDCVKERWDEDDDEDEDVGPVSSDFSNLFIAPSSTPAGTTEGNKGTALADGAHQVNGNHTGSQDFQGVNHDDLNGLLDVNASSEGFDGEEIEDASSKNYESLLEKFKALEAANTVLEEKYLGFSREHQYVCENFSKIQKENTKLKMDLDQDEQVNRNLRQDLEKMETENIKLRMELRHTYINEEFFKTQMALTETNKYIRMLEFLESTEMFNDSLDLRLCKEAHLGAREIIYQTLKRFSTDFVKDPKFDFELPEGLSEQAYIKLNKSVTDVKKNIQVGSGWASAQLGPYPNQTRTSSGLPQTRTSSFGLEALSATHSPFESLRSGSHEPISLLSRAPISPRPHPPNILLPPPNFGLFNFPPPPINQSEGMNASVKNEYQSGNTFFESVRANQASRAFPSASPGAIASAFLDPPTKGSQDQIIDQAKRKWPQMSEIKILEGLDKLRQRKVKIQNVGLVLELLNDLFETESSENGDLYECVICLDNIEFIDLKTEACGHFFHSRCIKQWLQTKQDCPICRKLLLSQEDFPALTPSQRPR